MTPMLLLLTPAQTTFGKAITGLNNVMNANSRNIADLQGSIARCQSLKITDPSLREAEQLLSRLEVPLLPVMYRCYPTCLEEWALSRLCLATRGERERWSGG